MTNNAAGGRTWTLYNEQMDMTIEIEEYPRPLIQYIEYPPEQVLLSIYDHFLGTGKTELNEKEGYFISTWTDSENKKTKLKYIVDNICHTVKVIYPENKDQEYATIRDKVINSFEIVTQ